MKQFRYPLIFAAVYLSWKLFYYTITHVAPLHNVWMMGILPLTHVYQQASGLFLQWLGFTVWLKESNQIYLNPNNGIEVLELCLGIPAMYFFVVSVFVLPAPNWSKRLEFLLAGLIGIFCLNIFRIAGLAIAYAKASPPVANFS
ncbi:MAG: archaeosortase/exosortase family protein [Bacteroidetes bacterium]|nr:archaeosortase/exosortase family protein [Bacteroidota bacterium]